MPRARFGGGESNLKTLLKRKGDINFLLSRQTLTILDPRAAKMII